MAKGQAQNTTAEKHDEAKPPRIPDEIAEAIFAAETELEMATLAFGKADGIAKFKKKQMEKAQDDLNDLVRQAKTGVGPLFAKPEEEQPWQEATLLALNGLGPHIPTAILQKLADHDPPIRTLGELVKLQKDLGDVWPESVPGIGRAARQKIDEVVEAYFAAHPIEEAPDTAPVSKGDD